MLSTLLLVAGGLTAFTYGVASGYRNSELEHNYKNYKETLKNNNLDSLSTKDIIEDLWQAGAINEQDYKKSLNTIDKLDNIAPKNINSFKEFWQELTTLPGTKKEGTELYKLIAANAHYLNSNNAKSYDELVKAVNNSFYSGLPTIADAPTPQYLDTMFEGTQVDVTDPKKWTAPELAELHNINYDMEHYYDLIKQSTEADINLGEYTNRQLETLANSQDTKNVTSYLDSIRNH